jgi:hypothetical protein
MNIKEDLKKRILSKIEEGYNEGGRLVEAGEVALYPDPAPAVDPTVQGSGKTLQVDSDLLRDLLNWATSADAGSIDAVVAKAEEMGVTAPLTPAQLVDLTATAQTADPSNPTVAAVGVTTQPEIDSPVVPAGPVGPLSPVMASFMRRGKKVEELASLPKMDKSGGIQIKTVSKPGEPPHFTPKQVAQITRAEKKAKAAGINPGEMTLLGTEEEQKVCEDDVIDSDKEAIVKPEEMGKKNPDIKPEGGQNLPDDTTRPIGKLNDPANLGGEGLAEDGVEDEAGESEVGAEGGVEDVAAAIAGGIADGIAGDTVETEPAVNALPGEGIPQNDDDATINAELGAPVAPAVGDVGGDGLVGQLAALQARVAELEALLGGKAAGAAPVAPVAPEAEIEVGGEEGEEGEDELSIDGEDEGEGEEAGEKEDAEDAEGEGEEDKEDDKEEDEASDDEKESDEEGEDEEGKKLLLGDEEEEKK